MTSSEPPPPYYEWMTVPDTSQLPPPPGFHYHASPTANASRDEADRAFAWTNANPLWKPRQLELPEAQALSIGFASVIRPPEFKGSLLPVRERPGTWNVRPLRVCNDSCLLSNVPLYSAILGAPKYEQSQIAYFEVYVKEMASDAGIAIGFLAPPYPTFRLPGWERASLGVHGDDGRKYINDSCGGQDFVRAFRPGEVIGIGMEFEAGMESKKGGQVPVKVFFTRDGGVEKSWDLHEHVDVDMDQPGGVTGLEGRNDLHAAVGVFGSSDFEIRFARHNWQYKPRQMR